MKQYQRILMLSAVISISIFVILKAQQTKIYKNIYQPLSNKSSYPKVFTKIDAKLQEFYSKTYPELIANNINVKEYFSNMDSTEFMEWAKYTFAFYNQPDKYTYKFMGKAFMAQRDKKRENKKNGIIFNEVLLHSPDEIFITIKRIIDKKYPWEWGLFLRSKFMLVVDVLDKRIGGLSYNPKSKARVFTCNVIYGIKGNFKEEKKIELALRPVDRHLKVGNRYFLLIEGNDKGNVKGKSRYFYTYILSWDGANHKSIFKVENDYIIDPNQDLGFGSSFSVQEYSSHVKSFYKKVLGDLYYEN